LLRREGELVNHKRVYRLYRDLDCARLRTLRAFFAANSDS